MTAETKARHPFPVRVRRVFDVAIVVLVIYAAIQAIFGTALLTLETIAPDKRSLQLGGALTFAVAMIGATWRWRGAVIAAIGAGAQRTAGLGPRTGLLAILTLGVILRLIWAVLLAGTPTSDGAVYLSLAKSLLAGRPYQMAGTYAFWPPGYPFFLSAWLWVLPAERTAILLSNLVLYVVASVGAWHLARRLVGVQGAMICVALLAIWPNYVAHAGMPEKEQITVACFPWIMLAIVAAADPGPKSLQQYFGLVCAGMLLGAASLVQPSMQIYPVVIAVYLVLRGVGIRRTLAYCGTIVLGAALLIAPWTLRNLSVLGKPVLISTNGGSTFYRANNPLATGAYVPRGEVDVDALGELEGDTAGKRLGLAWIRSYPAEFLALSLRKNVLFMGDDAVGVYASAKRGGVNPNVVVYTALKGLANLFWIGVWCVMLAALLPRRGTWPVMPADAVIVPLTFLAYFALHAIFESAGKYHVPLLGVVAVMLPVVCRTDNHEGES